jgi:hypothetical protein
MTGRSRRSLPWCASEIVSPTTLFTNINARGNFAMQPSITPHIPYYGRPTDGKKTRPLQLPQHMYVKVPVRHPTITRHISNSSLLTLAASGNSCRRTTAATNMAPACPLHRASGDQDCFPSWCYWCCWIRVFPRSKLRSRSRIQGGVKTPAFPVTKLVSALSLSHKSYRVTVQLTFCGVIGEHWECLCGGLDCMTGSRTVLQEPCWSFPSQSKFIRQWWDETASRF